MFHSCVSASHCESVRTLNLFLPTVATFKLQTSTVNLLICTRTFCVGCECFSLRQRKQRFDVFNSFIVGTGDKKTHFYVEFIRFFLIDCDLKGLSVILPSVLDFKFAFAATVFIYKLALWKLVNTIFKE